MNGFEDSGVWPVNRKIVLSSIKEKRPRAQMDPVYPSLLPRESSFREAVAAADRIEERYFDLLSSPTRGRIQHARETVREAALLYDHVQQRNRQDEEREQRLDRKMRRLVYKIPEEGTSDFISLSKSDIQGLVAERSARE
jgi:hypothetical protein